MCIYDSYFVDNQMKDEAQINLLELKLCENEVGTYHHKNRTKQG
jgi:hypothetical protein